MAPVVREAIKAAITPITDRLDAIEKRLDAVMQKGMVYRGVFDPNTRYEVGDVVSRGGSAWYAKLPGLGIAPDESSVMGEAMWQLMVKRGRDGKDAK
jgi:hypothetical protein